MAGLTLTFKGHVNVYLSNSSHSTDSEVYFKFEKDLGEDCSSVVTQPENEAAYPFYFRLPEDGLAHSFIGEQGKVEYVLEAVLHRPKWKRDEKVEKVVQVTFPLDLSLIPEASLPVDCEELDKFGCFCCISGSFFMSVRVPKGVFSPGERIPFEVVVNNASRKRFTHISAEIQQDVKYTANYMDQTTYTYYSKTKREKGLDAGESDTWFGEINVPYQLPPTKLQCSMIDVQYYLRIVANPVGCLEKWWSFPLVKCPIVIGNVPQ
ncbi:Arrestin domain-containing protein 3 [Orchesella cincta]|uniref:Arrestin domain-containing protein 3 n=1 Tax=Orchesella cincta TaxID=48709 RepID=A0A1D2MX07_ORCCI|nr:Arrestin domain-containing protein 3 [Orchesella cincta]